jgi:hypothetical protein
MVANWAVQYSRMMARFEPSNNTLPMIANAADKGFDGGLNFTRSTRFSSRPWPPSSYHLRIDLDT